MTDTPFLNRRLPFILTLAVLGTTLFSWFNLNSWCIILLVGCRLFTGRPLANVKKAFSDKLFLAWLIFFLIDTAGFLYTHNAVTQGKTITKEATLVAVAFVFCAGRFADTRSFNRLLTGYYCLMVAASFYCLGVAFHNYRQTGDPSVFFYHLLTRPISQNAVFFSVFVVFGLVFLLAPGGAPLADRLSLNGRRIWRLALALFMLGMVLLLNSKLILVITLLVLLHALFRKYSFRKNRAVVLVFCAALVSAIVVLALTDNPIKSRYLDMAAGDLALVRQKAFNEGIYFNPLQLRILEWRFANEIMTARRAWLFGVSSGDSQDLLDQKYIATHMYIGNPADGPNRKIRGFIGYNFHNQYLETLVRSGIIGLAVLLGIFGLLFVRAYRHGTPQAWFVILTIAVFFIPEAPLTMQHGVFFFCFFPLLALQDLHDKEKPAE